MNYKVANKYKSFLYIIDIIGNALFFWKRIKKLDQTNIKNIAVIRLDHIGDSLLTFPFFDNLRKNFIDAKISVITRPANKEILEYNKSVNEIITITPPWFNRENNNYSELIKFIKSNYKKFDLVFELHSDPRNILLASLIGKFSAGYGIRGFGFLLNRVIEYSNQKKNMIQRNLDILEGMGISTEFSYPKFSLGNKELIEANNLSFNAKTLNSKPKTKYIIPLNTNHKLICISPGAGRKDKYWLNERWTELCIKLIKEYDVTIIFTGDKKEEKNIAEIKKNLPKNRYIDLCSKTNLKQLCAVIKQCKLIISPDSAPIHIAKALSIHSIALFNKEDPVIWGYDNKNNISICKEGIEKIEVTDILSQIKKLNLL